MNEKRCWDKYSDLEKIYADKLRNLTESIENPVIKSILEGVSKDSVKHSLLYKTLLEMEKGYSKLIDETDCNIIAEEIDEHIRIESEMIRTVESLISDVDDKAMKFILEYILNDEHIHHAMLVRVKEMIIKRETLSKSDLWDLIWKDALYHGTPGG